MRLLPALLALVLAVPAAAEGPALRVLTYNVGAIPLVHGFVAERVEEIGRRLRAGPYDVVALQEVWLDSDAEALARGWPHSLRPRAGLIGSGLLLLSRFPIEASRFSAFSGGAAAHHLFLHIDGDAVCRKGVVAARIATPSGPVDVYNTHLIADDTPLENDVVRATQLVELDRAIRDFSAGAGYVLLGDLNFDSGGGQHRLLLDLLGVPDPCWTGGRESCGATFGGRRIDYVLASGSRASRAFERPARIRGTPMLLSDHAAGIEATVALPLRSLPSPRRLQALTAIRASLLQMAGELRRRWWRGSEAGRLERLAADIDADFHASARMRAR